MTGPKDPIDAADGRIRAMLERRVRRGAGLGVTLGERARAVARRDGGVGFDPAVSPVIAGARRVKRGTSRTILASAAAMLVVAVGLLVVVAQRPYLGPLSSSPPEGTRVGGLLAPISSSRLPAAGWDAITWRLAGSREVVFDGDSSSYVVDAAAWAGGVVAIGYDIEGATITGRVWRSIDGTDWREVTGGGPPFDAISLDRVFALGNRLVITGRDRSRELGGESADPGTPVAFESADGDTWTAVTDGGSPWLRPGPHAAALGGGTILVLENSEDSRLWRSSDGQTWTSRPLAAVFQQALVQSVAWTGSRWLAGGVVGERPQSLRGPGWGLGAVWSSLDGLDWTPAAIDAPMQSVGPFAVGRNGVVAVGGRTGGGAISLRDALWRSDNGSTWTALPLENLQLRLLADGERIVALDLLPDQRLRVRESFDGSEWRGLDVLGLGRFDPNDPATLEGLYFPGNLQPVVLTPGGVWAMDHQIRSDVEDGHRFTEAERRWFGAAGRLPGAAPFPSRPLPGSNDTPCLPAGQECG